MAYGLLLGGFLLLAGDGGRQGSGLDGFHAAVTVIGALAVLGLVVATTGFARSAVREGEMS